MESWAAPDWNPCPGGLRHALTFRQVSTHEVKLGHQRGCCSAKKKEPSSTSWVSVPRHKGDVQHNWYCDQVLKVNAESVRDWTEPLKQAIIFLRVGAVRTQDPQLGQLLVDLLKQLRFPHPVLIQSCLGLDHVFTQSWSCPPPRHGHDYNTALLTAQSTPWDQISFLCLYHLETHQAQGAGWWAEGEVERIHFTTGGIRESPVILGSKKENHGASSYLAWTLDTSWGIMMSGSGCVMPTDPEKTPDESRKSLIMDALNSISTTDCISPVNSNIFLKPRTQVCLISSHAVILRKAFHLRANTTVTKMDIFWTAAELLSSSPTTYSIVCSRKI